MEYFSMLDTIGADSVQEASHCLHKTLKRDEPLHLPLLSLIDHLYSL